jgi:membrane-bound lytic murein transglycosylase B
MLLLILPLALALALAPNENPRVEYVISEMVANGFSREEAEAFFADPRVKEYPPREIQPRTIDWDKIIATLVEPASVERGRKFVATHEDTLRLAEGTYGVEKEVLTAILRLESNLGQNSGRYIVFNAYYTYLLQSEVERKWKWAAENLVALVSYCRARGETDCLGVLGSYAGAMGPAQFLPVSVLKWGRDGNGDEVVNPFEFDDALLSAANFLIEHGWREDKMQALQRYYGSGQDYPRAIMAYAVALGMQALNRP